MRLTLRTLLAYLDDILDEEDAQQLHAKIVESEVASKLVHRIRNVVGQVRPDLPELNGTGMGVDANSVADYLDNTLPAERVPDFERVCLDSDMHLSEVAACHQILTLVLGEPADISDRLKNRIYDLAGPAPKTATQTGTSSPPKVELEAQPGVHQRIDIPKIENDVTTDVDERWTEAPDYLKRRRRSRLLPVSVAALIFFCLALAGLRGMGPFDRSHPLMGWLGIGTDDYVQLADESSTQEPLDGGSPERGLDRGIASKLDNSQDSAIDLAPPQPLDERNGGARIDNPIQRNDELQTGDQVVPPPADNGQIVELALPPNRSPPLDGGEPQLPNPFPEIDNPLPPDTDEIDLPPSDIVDVDQDGVAPVDPDGLDQADENIESSDPIAGASLSVGEKPEPLVPPDPTTLINPLAENDTDSRQPTIIPAIPADASRGDADAPTVQVSADTTSEAGSQAAVDVGRFISDEQLLLRLNDQQQIWLRVPARHSLEVGDQLMSLPKYRPQLMLSTGVQISLAGASSIRLGQPSADDTPNVRMEFGRATIATFAQTASRIGIELASRSGVIEFADMDTGVAIEVVRAHVPGTDPAEYEAHVILRLLTTSGSVNWLERDKNPITIAAGQQFTAVDDRPGHIDEVNRFPLWIDGKDARPIDPKAARRLSPFITQENSVALKLLEQAESKSVEIRSLAVCSLAYLGDADPLIAALNDTKLRSYWQDQYRALKASVSMDRENAKKIRQSIENKHGENGKFLYRVLWGFSPEQLEAGGAQKLVEFLDHDSPDFRVAAIETLKDITGLPSLYMPHYNENKRRGAVFKWSQKQKKGEIAYRQQPEIVKLLQEDDSP